MSSIPQLILIAAQDHGVDPELALAVATAESGQWWQNGLDVPDSPTGAIGIFQLEPATAADLGVNPRDPQQNIDGGVRYLGQLLAQFGDPVEAVAAYNWGEGRVANALAQFGPLWIAHAPAETQNYLNRIFGNIAPPVATGIPDQSTGAPGAPPISVPQMSVPLPPTASPASQPLFIGLAALALLWIVSEAV